ncbi:MAG: response regulator [Bryobacteraceae bacterium]
MKSPLLLIEYETLQRESLAWVLRKRGWEVDEAADNQHALSLLIANRYAAVILDLGPDMNGFDVLESASSVGCPVPPALVVSAYVEPPVWQRFISLGIPRNTQPAFVLRRSVRIRAGEHACYDFDLEEGQELVVTMAADDYVGISICGRNDYGRWLKTGELMEYDGEDDARDCKLSVVAPRDGAYSLLVINEGREDVDVTVDAAVWEPVDEE